MIGRKARTFTAKARQPRHPLSASAPPPPGTEMAHRCTPTILIRMSPGSTATATPASNPPTVRAAWGASPPWCGMSGGQPITCSWWTRLSVSAHAFLYGQRLASADGNRQPDRLRRRNPRQPRVRQGRLCARGLYARPALPRAGGQPDAGAGLPERELARARNRRLPERERMQGRVCEQRAIRSLPPQKGRPRPLPSWNGIRRRIPRASPACARRDIAPQPPACSRGSPQEKKEPPRRK